MEARDSAGSISHHEHALQRFTDFTFVGDDQVPPSASGGHEESEGHTTSGYVHPPCTGHGIGFLQ